MSEPQNGLAEFMIGFLCGIGCAIATAMLAGLAWSTLPTVGALLGLAYLVGLGATVALIVRFFRQGRSACAAGAITGAALPFLALGACAAVVAASGFG
ncbi:MAG: hypothetical protein NT029_00555 [Armatimonadetes bacterium]|nr:hypothetical protein [Armatimonadota bacterium]